MQMRKVAKESWERFLAMASSSAVAMARVSRSASLLRQVMTRCFRSGDDDVAAGCGGLPSENLLEREDAIVCVVRCLMICCNEVEGLILIAG